MSKLRSNDSWLSRLIPFGLVGQSKPHHYREMLGVLWENKAELPYAWNILKHGVCDGCSLGPYGLRDNVMDGVHLCMTRLKLLKLNTMGALDMSATRDINSAPHAGTGKTAFPGTAILSDDSSRRRPGIFPCLLGRRL